MTTTPVSDDPIQRAKDHSERMWRKLANKHTAPRRTPRSANYGYVPRHSAEEAQS